MRNIKLNNLCQLACIVAVMLLVQMQVNARQQSRVDSLNLQLQETGIAEDKIDILAEIADLYELQGDWEKHDKTIFKLKKIAEEENDSINLGDAYNSLGISSCYQGKNKEALKYFNRVLEINKAMNRAQIVSNSYENLGLVYKDMGDYENAIDCQLKSIEIRKENGHPRLFNNYMKLSVLYGLLGDLKKQDSQIQKAQKELNSKTDVSPNDKAIFYNELGDIYEDRNLLDSSEVCYKRVIKFSEQIGWNKGIAVGTGNLAVIYSDLGKLDSAAVYHKHSLQISEQINDCIGIAEECLALASIYHKLGVSDSVMPYANNALERTLECDLLDEQAGVLKFISDFYSESGKYKEAYSFLEQYYEVKDSVASVAIKNNIAELETRFETKEKEQEIVLLQAENRIQDQKVIVFISISTALLLLVFLGVLLHFKKKRENQFQQLTLRQQLLRSQMNPHFIFNVLGSIQNYMLGNNAKRAAGYLAQFASLIRATLEYSTSDTIELSTEIKMLQNYMELEQMRNPEKFSFKINVADDLESDFIYVPPMMIQPFIENSIKHGFKKLNCPGKLELTITDKNSHVEFIIQDNGVGLNGQKQQNENHRSMATEIFEKRKKIIQQKHKKEFRFSRININDIDPLQSGAKIVIDVPVFDN